VLSAYGTGYPNAGVPLFALSEMARMAVALFRAAGAGGGFASEVA
jgi:hypothetical protein